ncbi:hypothetical protein AZ54_12670 [Xanthomonas oryzae pv. oryzae PXO86]|nr:hypothetical protein AZ54_12670 [Xanthomonas oryzae pv. oryzae PXO86]
MQASIGVDAIRDAGDLQSAVCLVRRGVEIVEVRALSSGMQRPANPFA